MSDLSKLLAKTSQSLEQFLFFISFDSFSLFYSQEKISSVALLSFALFKERLERFTSVTIYKRATASNLLRSLMTKERQEWFTHFRKPIALSLTKTSESLEKPMSEFRILPQTGGQHCWCKTQSSNPTQSCFSTAQYRTAIDTVDPFRRKFEFGLLKSCLTFG